jgi:hypothetical protein
MITILSVRRGRLLLEPQHLQNIMAGEETADLLAEDICFPQKSAFSLPYPINPNRKKILPTYTSAPY